MLPSSYSFLLLFHCFAWQGVSAVWRRDCSSSVLRVPTCSLPGMATFVSASKPNFRVTSTRDPAPLISYHTDDWTPAYSQDSLASPATSHTHEMRASVIMKTSDVTSSWPLTPDEGVSSPFPGHRNERECFFLCEGHMEHKEGELQNLWFYCSFCLGHEIPSVLLVMREIAETCLGHGLTCPLLIST